MASAPGAPLHLHASAVAYGGRALLFTGPSGTGKTAMALELMALGCRLVADDTVLLHVEGGRLFARPAAATAGLIEARGLGILQAEAEPEPVPVLAEVDLSRDEQDRLPRPREIDRFGVRLPLLLRPHYPNAAPALLQYLKGAPTRPGP